MGARAIFDPNGFSNVYENGEAVGYSFRMKAQYYRGITLSIVRGLEVAVDGEEAPRGDLIFTVNGQPFTLEEMRTVTDPAYRWEFGDYAAVTVKKAGGLARGSHHIRVLQVIAPSYMPFQLEANCEADFVVE